MDFTCHCPIRASLWVFFVGQSLQNFLLHAKHSYFALWNSQNSRLQAEQCVWFGIASHGFCISRFGTYFASWSSKFGNSCDAVSSREPAKNSRRRLSFSVGTEDKSSMGAVPSWVLNTKFWACLFCFKWARLKLMIFSKNSCKPDSVFEESWSSRASKIVLTSWSYVKSHVLHLCILLALLPECGHVKPPAKEPPGFVFCNLQGVQCHSFWRDAAVGVVPS